MKKNKMMRLASVLLVLTLLSTSVISGTFAKYVTSNEASDKARVAKWGIELEVTGQDVFTTEYDGTVKSSVDTEDVVAPGTKNDTGVTFSIKGKPEVAFKLTAGLSTSGSAVEDIFLKAGTYKDYTTANDETDEFTLSKDYYPVVFTLVHTYIDGWPILTTNVTAGDSNKIGTYDASNIYSVICDTTLKTVTVTGTLTDINAVLGQLSTNMEKVDPNYPLNDTFKLTWAWAFPTPEDKQIDKADTLLGNLAADAAKYKGTMTDGIDYNLDLNFSFNITVEQVD